MLLSELSERLQAFAAGATLSELKEAGGHAGLTFLFGVSDRIGALSQFGVSGPNRRFTALAKANN